LNDEPRRDVQSDNCRNGRFNQHESPCLSMSPIAFVSSASQIE
jgi:hypothetical protein